MTITLLVIDPDTEWVERVRTAVTPIAWIVADVGSGEDAMLALPMVLPAMIVLDLGAADGRGLLFLAELCKARARNTPVMVTGVAATLDVQTRVLALRIGADDVLVRSGSGDDEDLEMFVARAVSLIRAAHKRAASAEEHGEAGSLVLAGRVAKLRGIPLELTATEYDLLMLLVHAYPNIVTYERMARMWGGMSIGAMSALTSHVGRLRRKLEARADTDMKILNRYKVGYCLVQKDGPT